VPTTQLHRLVSTIGFGVGLLFLGTVTGCSSDSSPQRTPAAVQTAPTVPDGSTLKAVKARGKIRIGVKFDVPLFGVKGASDDLQGFDIEISKIIAQDLFGTSKAANRIEFIEALSKNREKFLQAGTVDLVVSTYTITESRKQFVDFAGPYYIAGQDILARKRDIESGSISGVSSLNGRKVCAVTGSTSLANLLTAAPRADTTFAAERYPECFAALQAGKVDAMTTDDVILLGLAQNAPGEFALTGNPFHSEPYGVGLPKGDVSLRAAVNASLTKAFADGRWESAFRSTVGTVGANVPAPPELDP
jgi:glutamate transport system substrate-binding protein